MMNRLEAAARQAAEPVAASLGDIVAIWDQHAPGEYMTALHMQAKRALAGQQPTSPDKQRWCQYVAGMIAGWLDMLPDQGLPINGDARTQAIAGIIERRLWAMPNDAHPAPTQQPVLVRDLAEILGATVPEVCDALAECGGPRRSTNMAVSGLEAVVVAAMLKQVVEPVVGWVLLREDADGFEPIMFYGGKEKPEGEFKDRFTLRPIRFADATHNITGSKT